MKKLMMICTMAVIALTVSAQKFAFLTWSIY